MGGDNEKRVRREMGDSLFSLDSSPDQIFENEAMSMQQNAELPTIPDEPLDVLVVAAHPDDAEISVGGTILTSLREGKRVGILDLTDGEPTPRGTPQIRGAETRAASEILGISWRGNLGLPNRSLRNELASRRLLAEVFRLTQPRTILTHHWEDSHPDHVAASVLCDEARFWAKLSKTEMKGEPYYPPRLFYYFSIHLRNHPRPHFVVDISDDLDKKLTAVACYESQSLNVPRDGRCSIIDDIRDRARYWGWSIRSAFGEPFVSREEIGVSTLDDILSPA